MNSLNKQNITTLVCELGGIWIEAISSVIRVHIVFVVILFAVPASVAHAGPTSDGLTVAVTGAMNRGLSAAKLGQWPQAIQYFSEAQQVAPYSPSVLFNLALANDKAGGREFNALAWYHDSLAVAPSAKNSAQVRARIQALETQIESNAQLLTDMAKAAAIKFTYSPFSPDIPPFFYKVVDALLMGNDVVGAKEIAALTSDKGDNRSENYQRIVKHQLKTRDIVGAKLTVELITDDLTLYDTLSDVAIGRATIGDYVGAKQTADRVEASTQDRARKILGLSKDYSAIALKQAQAGKMKDARDTAEKARSIAEDIESDKYAMSIAMSSLALAQSEFGDTEGAAESIALSIEGAEYAPRGGFFGDLALYSRYQVIAWYFVAVGDAKGAREFASGLTSEGNFQLGIFAEIVEKQAEKGDFPGAIATASGISDHAARSYAFSKITLEQAKARDINGARQSVIKAKQASQSVVKISDAFPSTYMLVEALAAVGNINDARKTAATLTNKRQSREACWHIAKARARVAANVRSGSTGSTDTSLPCLPGYLVSVLAKEKLFADFQTFVKQVNAQSASSAASSLSKAAVDMREMLERFRSFSGK